MFFRGCCVEAALVKRLINRGGSRELWTAGPECFHDCAWRTPGPCSSCFGRIDAFDELCSASKSVRESDISPVIRDSSMPAKCFRCRGRYLSSSALSLISSRICSYLLLSTPALVKSQRDVFSKPSLSVVFFHSLHRAMPKLYLSVSVNVRHLCGEVNSFDFTHLLLVHALRSCPVFWF